MTESRVTLPGSHRPAVPATDVVGPLDPATVLEISVVLRRRAEPDAAAFTGAPLTRDELARRYGADPADLDAVSAAVTRSGAEVVAIDPAARLVRVRGTAGVLGALFGTSLQQVAAGVPGQRRRSGELSVPAQLAGRLTAVLGLDDRPQVRARFAVAPDAARAVSYTPLQLATAYDLPPGDGAGQRIAVIELGGGFGTDDLTAYFGGLGLRTPSVTAVGVDGATNAAGQDPQGADGEVLLDIEVAGAIAPGAEQFVYFAPNTDAGFVDAISRAAHATPAPTAMTISWGQSEDRWSAQGRRAMDAALADAALLGVTVTVAAGDNGSADAQTGSGAHVDFPASSPHVLGCGGTALHLAADGSVADESVWNDGGAGGATGGGVSDHFARPAWQADAGVPARAATHGAAAAGAAAAGAVAAAAKAGRGVPDVAAVADPQTGYRVRVDGTDTVIGGTSAVAPLWAGIVCRLAAALGRPLGLLAPALYAGATPGHVPAGFRDITSGSNGAYSAQPGWDACTGLGVPVGTALLEALRSAPPVS